MDHYIVITTTFEKKSLVLLHFYGNKSYTILESLILSFIICVYNNVRQQKNNYGKISAAERDLQLIRDVVFDLICGVTPLMLPFLIHGIPININEAIFILLVPSLSMFGKVRSLFKEVLFHNLDMLIIKQETRE